MARISIIMDFDFDGFEELDEKQKIEAIKTVLDSGAESTCSDIDVESVAFLRG